MKTSNINFTPKLVGIGIVASAFLISGCSDDDNNSNNSEMDYNYEISVVNLTAGQPLSPIAVIAHSENFRVFTIGEAATSGLEIMAEGGDNSTLLSEAMNAGAYDTQSGSAPLPPAASETISVTVASSQKDDLHISLSTMLVNTNDAFTGIRSLNLGELQVGEMRMYEGLSYDAGTEANTEAAGTIPGPADGGTGYSSVRDDIADQVTMHPGVITLDDGLTGSVLTQAHRWDNPVIRVTISRTE